MRNRVNYEIKASKNRYFSHNLEINKGNSKKTWKLLNSLMNKPTTATSVNEIKKDSDIIIDRKCIAVTFNNLFVEVGPELARDIPQTHIDYTNFLTQSSCNFNFKHISTGCVVATIAKIPSKKASGLDNIPCSIIKNVARIISGPLSKILF